MSKKEISLIINSAFALLELLARLRRNNPRDFESHEEELQELGAKADELLAKPDDYLQNWRP